MTAALGALAVLVAAFVKGAVAFGFPTLATPLLALLIDVKSAVAILILPNLVMDSIQALRRPGIWSALRRHAVLYASGIAGTFIGTYQLERFSDRQALLVLGAFIVAFVLLNVTRFRLRVDPRRERYLAAPAGLIVGVMGGITNAHGTPLVLYLYALGLDKAEFVRTVAVAFILYKAAQLVAVTHAGMMTPALFGVSCLAALVALAGFAVGLRVQDRMNQAAFNRAVLVVLAVVGVFLVARSLR